MLTGVLVKWKNLQETYYETNEVDVGENSTRIHQPQHKTVVLVPHYNVMEMNFYEEEQTSDN